MLFWKYKQILFEAPIIFKSLWTILLYYYEDSLQPFHHPFIEFDIVFLMVLIIHLKTLPHSILLLNIVYLYLKWVYFMGPNVDHLLFFDRESQQILYPKRKRVKGRSRVIVSQDWLKPRKWGKQSPMTSKQVSKSFTAHLCYLLAWMSVYRRRYR